MRSTVATGRTPMCHRAVTPTPPVALNRSFLRPMLDDTGKEHRQQ